MNKQLLALTILCLTCGRSQASDTAPMKPNIILILADYPGWSDLGCCGAGLHETPRLDQLAGEGVRFTQAYAMSVCSPARAALMTGKHAARVGITIWSEGSRSGPAIRKLLQAESLHGLPHTETTIAKLNTSLVMEFPSEFTRVTAPAHAMHLEAGHGHGTPTRPTSRLVP